MNWYVQFQRFMGTGRFILGFAVLFGLSSNALCQGASSKPPTVAVMTLQAKGVKNTDADVITDAISNQLQQIDRLRVLERSRMDLILGEQGLQKSGACDGAECAVQVGKLLAVDRILVGSVGLVGRTYTLNLRMVDVGTGEVLRARMRSRQGSIDEVLTNLVPETVSDLTEISKENHPARSDAPRQKAKAGRLHWGWWLLGTGVAAGAAVAAVVMMEESSDTPSAMPTTSLNTTW